MSFDWVKLSCLLQHTIKYFSTVCLTILLKCKKVYCKSHKCSIKLLGIVQWFIFFFFVKCKYFSCNSVFCIQYMNFALILSHIAYTATLSITTSAFSFKSAFFLFLIASSACMIKDKPKLSNPWKNILCYVVMV